MMKNRIFHKSSQLRLGDSGDYILTVAGLVFLYMSLKPYTRIYYEWCLIIPCMLAVGSLREHNRNLKNKKRFILPCAMVIWFFLLQGKRNLEDIQSDNIGLFLSVYLFSFPLASLLQDGDRKKTLKIFAMAYTAAAAVLSAYGVLLLTECLPGFLAEYVFWNGGRLETIWHPNVAACFLMIGIVFCTTFMVEQKAAWSKIVTSAFLLSMIVVLALTNCRTAIIMTGGYFGSMVFFKLIRYGRKWFLPGIVSALILAAVFYGGAGFLYQANCDRLIKEYSQQYYEQTESDVSDVLTSEEEYTEEEYTEEEYTEEEYTEEEYTEEEYTEEEESADDHEERISYEVNPETGDIYLVTDSDQESIFNDFGTLNSRTYIWSAAKFAIRETPSILYWGMKNPGWYVSFYNFFPISHLHNAWLECLVGMGVVGFLMAMLFTMIAVWNALMVLLRHNQDIWKRNVAILVLCLLVASFLEPYLFYTTIDYHLPNFLFFLCSGYLVHWQEKDNCYLIEKIRGWILSLRG